MPLITITLGEEDNEKDIRFDVDMEAYNEFLNNQTPNDKIGPAYNFLINTVNAEDKATFKELVLVDKKPNGMLVLLIVGQVTAEISGNLTVKIKKPKTSLSK